MDPLRLAQIGMAVVEKYSTPDDAIAFVDKMQQQKETKLIIEEVENLLDTNDGISPVHSHFYLLASDLHKIQGKHALYYRASLRYLGCTELASLSKEEQANHAFHLALAALLGDRIFNFGELLAHEVLQSLKGTEHAWLIDLLLAFNCGDVAKFRALKP